MSLEDNLVILVQAIGADIKALHLNSGNIIIGPLGPPGPPGSTSSFSGGGTTPLMTQAIMDNLLSNISNLQTQVVNINSNLTGISDTIFDSGNF